MLELDQTDLPPDIQGVEMDEVLARDLGLAFSTHLPGDYRGFSRHAPDQQANRLGT